MKAVVTKKRFIAGAVCPSCGEMDTIRLFVDSEGRQIKECVECDYSEAFSSQPELKGNLPEARFPEEESVLEAEVDIIKIIPSN